MGKSSSGRHFTHFPYGALRFGSWKGCSHGTEGANICWCTSRRPSLLGDNMWLPGQLGTGHRYVWNPDPPLAHLKSIATKNRPKYH